MQDLYQFLGEKETEIINSRTCKICNKLYSTKSNFETHLLTNFHLKKKKLIEEGESPVTVKYIPKTTAVKRKEYNDKYYAKNKEKIIKYLTTNTKRCELCNKNVSLSGFYHHQNSAAHLKQKIFEK